MRTPVDYYIQNQVGRAGRPRMLDEFMQRQLIADYQSGLGSEDVGKIYGMSHGTVLKYLKMHGVPPHPHGRPKGSVSGPTDGAKTSIADRKEMLRLANNPRMTLQQIGNRFGVTREYVRQVLKNNGVRLQHTVSWIVGARENQERIAKEKATRKAAREGRLARMSQAWIDGMSCRDIGREFFGGTNQQQAATRIAYYRKSHPELFPLRNRTREEMGKIKLENRRRIEANKVMYQANLKRMSEAWRAGMEQGKMARLFTNYVGKDPYAYMGRLAAHYRKKFGEAMFPKRQGGRR